VLRDFTSGSERNVEGGQTQSRLKREHGARTFDIGLGMGPSVHLPFLTSGCQWPADWLPYQAFLFRQCQESVTSMPRCPCLVS